MVSGKVSGASNSTGPVVSTGEGTATVQQGESNLKEISNRLGVSEQSLRDANPQIKGNKLQAGQELKLPEKQTAKTSSSETHVRSETKTSASEARSRTAEMKLKGNYVEATLRQRVESPGAPPKGASASPLNGLRVGWMNDGSEVKITRSLSPAGGHDTRMDAIAFARLTGADPTAVVKDREGKWHAVQTNQNFYGGLRAASDNGLRGQEGLAHYDSKKIADVQQKIVEARKNGDFDDVKRLQKHLATLIFGVQETEINPISKSNDRVANKININ